MCVACKQLLLLMSWHCLGAAAVCCRYERSGTMHGLFRVRGFTQDDAHIFCLPEQIEPEIRGVLDLVQVRRREC
jgi:threonyl-tRNA synthetase